MGFGMDVRFSPAWLPYPTLYEGLFKVFMVSFIICLDDIPERPASFFFPFLFLYGSEERKC